MVLRLGKGLGYVFYRLGFALRETGQALDRVGSRLEGSWAFREELNRSRTLMNIFHKKPELGRETFVAPSASLVGRVTLGNQASVFYGSVLRADKGRITVGPRTNIQDGVVIRTGPGCLGEHECDTVLGSDVTVGHLAALHGARVGDGCLVGMGAVLGHGVVMEPGSMVAANAVVVPGTAVPAGQVWGGNPARFVRVLKPDEAAFLPESAKHYVSVAAEHSYENGASLEEIAQAKGLAA